LVNVSIARRYARALLDLGAKANNLDAIGAALDAFARALKESAELQSLMEDPAIAVASRQAVLSKILEAMGAPQELASMLRLMVDRARMSYLPAIARGFRDMVDAQSGRIRAKITSAVPLEADAQKGLEAALAKLTPGKVSLETAVEPRLLGGVITQIGSTVYDGSLKNQLEMLGSRLRA
jgi:F-type H+-transporting ATPase subunit delta